MIIPKRKIYFIVSTFVLLIVVALCVIRPTSNEIKDMSTQIHTQREELEKLYLRGQFLKPAKEQYEKAKLQIPDLSKIFVAEGDELQIITVLEQAAAKNNLDQEINLKEIGGDEDGAINGYMPIPITLKIIGNYKNLIKYLSDLESLDYYINIDDFKIFTLSAGGFTIVGRQPASDSVSVLINGNIYRKKL